MANSSATFEYKLDSNQKKLLKPEDWNQIILILKFFNYNINNTLTRNLKNQDYFWNLIISIQKKLIEKIEQQIKNITGFCYKINSKNQINEITKIFLRLNHLVDQNIYQYSYNSYYGLYNFLKLIKTTYGNIDKFMAALKFLNNTSDFFDNKHNEILIDHYIYICNMELPENKYMVLQKSINNILLNYNNFFPLLKDSQKLSDFLKEVEDVKKTYIIKYYKEHEKFQNKLKKFYDNLYSLPEYILLQKLSETDFNINHKIPVKKYINNFFPKICSNNKLKKQLKNQPKCSCGFSLNSSIYIPSMQKIVPMLKEGIESYI